jgi:DNA-binding transcriptional MerR regulator
VTLRPYLRTSDLARAVGAHPNTVRLYEVWGLLPPIPRSPAGYRLYTKAHLDQMKLARLALHGDHPGRAIRQSAAALVKQAAAGDLGGALEMAYRHLALVQAERAQAEAAVRLVERWADGAAADATAQPLSVKDAAKLLGVSTDVLRNWERSGLIKAPRDPRNRYRRYGAAELSRLRVIRTLFRAGYGALAILRMLRRLDQGRRDGLRQALDTPPHDEDIVYATDHWLSCLVEQEQRAHDLIAQIEDMIRKQTL